MLRKTKIIATLGPSSDSEKMIEKLIKAGVNVFRINFSHSTPQTIELYVKRVQKIREKLNQPISIMVDTRGPEVRVCSFKDKKIMLKRGQKFSFVSNNIMGDNTKVQITQKICVDNAKIGGVVLANDGRLKLRIIDKKPNELVCKVCAGGELRNNKSLSFVNQHFDFEYLNEKDREDLKQALNLGVEYISASFVNTVKDLNVLKNYVYQFDENIKIIAKIENRIAINNLDEIVSNCDGVMVARGDLGVEASFEKLPIYQRKIISYSKKHSKTSIVATEMLESMITSIRPTRAEISDVAKAVFDGSGVVMLSGESAMGHDPVSCVKTMVKILKEAESEFDYYTKFNNMLKNPKTSNDLIIQSAVNASFFLGVKAIVTYTSKGTNALKFSTKFAKVPIVAIADNKKTFNSLSMISNCVPVLSKKEEDIFNQAKSICLKNKIAQKNDLIIVTTGTTDKISNVLKFVKID